MSGTLTLVLAGFAVWTGLAVLSAVQSALYLEQYGRPVVWRELLGNSLIDWYSCAVFTPALFWLARRFPLDRRHWRVALPVTLAAIGAFVVLKYAFVAQLPVWPGRRAVTLSGLLVRNFISENVFLWAALGVVYGIESFRRLRDREVQLARVSGELTAARLDALTAQLQPHFLFNSLHGVSVLMHRDVEAADAMLASLGDLLRHALDPHARHELPLAGELELLGSYLGVLRARFGDRLTVRTDVTADAARALVPRLVLQPLVENAVEHGIARRRGAGCITIRADSASARLRLVVADDGAGLASPPREGIGLSNTRRRLRELYGDEQSLTLEDLPGGGLSVALSLPYRAEPAAAR